MIVIKEFSFSAAHSLSKVADDHQCKRIHGHNYRVRIECSSEELDHSDMVIDFAVISASVRPLIDMLDHRNINEVVRYDNTTAEWLCNWFADQLCSELPVSAVEVWETATCGARKQFG